MYDDEARDAAMDMPYDDLDARTAYGGGGGGSPIDGSGSTSGAEDGLAAPPGGTMGMVGGTMNVLGKPIVTNNFVTKLYQ